MFTVLINMAIVFGLLTLVFLSPACMSVGLCRVSNKEYYIDKKDFLLSCIPVFNHFYGWSKYSGGSKLSLSGISTVLLYLVYVVRAVIMYYYFDSANLQTTTIWVFLISVVIFWVCNAIDIYRILSDSGVYTFGQKATYAFTVIIGQIIVGYYMPRKMYYYFTKAKKGTLYGRG